MSPTIDRSSTEPSSPVYMMPAVQKKLQQIKSIKSQPSESGSFEQLLDNIRHEFNRPDNIVDVDSLWQVLEDYQSNPADWSKFAHYDSTKYKRNFVDGGDKYDVMIIAWGPGTQSCIHDHPGSHCFMKILEGGLIESRFAWPNGTGQMRKIVDTHAKLNEIIYINDRVALHQVSNLSQTKNAASLHIYIPPITKCRAFDPLTGKARECDLTFYSKCGKILN